MSEEALSVLMLNLEKQQTQISILVDQLELSNEEKTQLRRQLQVSQNDCDVLRQQVSLLERQLSIANERIENLQRESRPRQDGRLQPEALREPTSQQLVPEQNREFSQVMQQNQSLQEKVLNLESEIGLLKLAASTFDMDVRQFNQKIDLQQKIIQKKDQVIQDLERRFTETENAHHLRINELNQKLRGLHEQMLNEQCWSANHQEQQQRMDFENKLRNQRQEMTDKEVQLSASEAKPQLPKSSQALVQNQDSQSVNQLRTVQSQVSYDLKQSEIS